jgi:hypothetical protein
VTEAIIIISALGAAVYLLAPLRRRPGAGGRILLLLLPALLNLVTPSPVVAQPGEPFIGLLLIAVDAQRDHLRVSEALRLVNPAFPRAVELEIALPPGAVYFTPHRGIEGLRPTSAGFSGRAVLGRGVHEVIYSYALPAKGEQRFERSFPLHAARLEIVVRGSRVHLAASRGTALPPIGVGGARLPRWEARDLGRGVPIVVDLRGLPVSRPWVPRSAAAVLAVVLAGGLTAAATRRVSAVGSEVEESSPVRRT